MFPSWGIALVTYLAVGAIVVGIGFVTMLRSTRRRELKKPRVLARIVGLGAVAFVCWPAVVMLALIWQFPAGRTWMIGYFGGGR